MIPTLRNKLIADLRNEKDPEYRSGYVDGVLDFYNGLVGMIVQKKEMTHEVVGQGIAK